MYILNMHRHGELCPLHKYTVGVYNSFAEAQFFGQVEEYWRGGKYSTFIVDTDIEKDYDVSKLKVSDNEELIQERVDFFFEHCGGYR